MKDMTNIILKQSKEFGRKANLNFTRIDNATNMVRNIFRKLRAKEMNVLVMAESSIVARQNCTVKDAVKLVKAFAEEFFLSICYTNDGSKIKIHLTGTVTKRNESEPESSENDCPGLEKEIHYMNGKVNYIEYYRKDGTLSYADFFDRGLKASTEYYNRSGVLASIDEYSVSGKVIHTEHYATEMCAA